MLSWRVSTVFNVLGARPLEGLGWAATVEASADQGALYVSGWVLAQGVRVTQLEIWQGSVLATCQPDRASPDVGAHYPGHAEAANCRFALSLPMAEMPGSLCVLSVHATTANGQRMHVATVVCKRPLAAATRIFVVGSPRSGTTVVGNALRRAMRLPNLGESHLLPLLGGILEDVDHRLGAPATAEAAANAANLVAHVAPDELRERLGEQFRAMVSQLNQGDDFCDKTPGVAMLRRVPAALHLWPDARVVFCRRRGLENVASRMRKFEQADFASQCGDWATAMKVWLEVRAVVPEGQRCEVDQFDLLAQPEQLGHSLAAWAGLSEAQGREVARYISTQHPEQTAQAGEAQALADMNWSAKQTAVFREVCGPVMAAYGYTEDASYRLAPHQPEAV